MELNTREEIEREITNRLNRVTYVRNEDGTWGKKAADLLISAADVTADFFRTIFGAFDGLMVLAIKIGLLAWLWPYIVKFVMSFARLISDANGMPFPFGG